MSTFQNVVGQHDWPRMEHRVLEFWRESDAFGKLVRQNAGGEPWSFQDGPITANNPMGVHHAWGRTYKDVWQRFYAMQGRDLRWQNGFDCQGLWVEVNVEKALGFRSKRDIEAYGLAGFVRRCKQRVLESAALQTEQSIRLGMWMHWDDPETLRWLAEHVDEDDPVTVQTPMGEVTATVEQLVGQLGREPWRGSYFTFADHNNYMIWRFLKACHERGWVYRGTDVMPWCARCGTGLSQHEIATEGYRELTHRSPTLRFPLPDQEDASLLVWTTTPWTLTSNVAAAVGPELDYLEVEQDGQRLYLAKGAAKQVLQGKQGEAWDVVRELKGAEMLGWRYAGPFDELPAQAEAGAVEAHRVIPWSEVGAEEGTGVVHIAPGCGAEDFGLSKEHGLPIIAPLDENGVYKAGFDWLSGREAQAVTEDILANLREKGLLYKVEGYEHRYPVCWRCESELVFRLVDEWFISMGELYDKPREEVTEAEKAASLRYQMMDSVDQARWIPAFGREREQDWLRNMHDWMISKKRYWGLALPIWVCQSEDCDWFDVIGGREELEDRAVAGWETFDGHSPHRPYVDAVEIACPSCGGSAARVPDVGNPWLDAGIVSLSTLPDTLPYEKAKERWFPADFITESFPGQFRNWFYSLLAMSTVLEGQTPFKTVLGFATLLAEDGREMHKSWGNAIEFNEGADEMGADVMRWMYLAHRPEVDLWFGYGPGAEVRRRFLIPLWNVYGFFVQYANLAEGWSPAPGWDDAAEGAADEVAQDPAGALPRRVNGGRGGGPEDELDRWIRLRLHATVREVTERMVDYDGYRATLAIEAFVEELSNWYVRRSRRRFWEGEPAALDTLYEVLVTLARLLAPMLPFTAETLYQNLVREVDEAAPESVHHCRWPVAAEADADDRELLNQMALILRLTALGRAARSAADLKLRQPLAKAMLALRGEREAAAIEHLGAHLREELNVKALETLTEEGGLVTYSLRPVLPKLGPKHGQRVPAIRKALEAADAGAVAAAVKAGQPVTLEVDGQPLQLEPDEIELMASAREGLATAEDEGYVVGLVTELSPELEAEGLARDLLRAVQSLRKDTGLEVSDRIELWVEGPPAIAEAAEAWREHLRAEALAATLTIGGLPADAEGRSALEIEGHAVELALKRASASSSRN